MEDRRINERVFSGHLVSWINEAIRDKATSFEYVTNDEGIKMTSGVTLFPDPHDYRTICSQPIPLFDGITGNFPFVQQEDSPKEEMLDFFKKRFGIGQGAFMHGGRFEINERTDYFTYCVYNAFRFLKDGGVMSVITSNAWLGKEYGLQFKKFLLDNFHVKYVVRSKAEHWFKEPQVSTLYLVLEKIHSDAPSKFVTLNFRLEDVLDNENVAHEIDKIGQMYASIDYCDDPQCRDWEQSHAFADLYSRKDGSMDVGVIPHSVLSGSLESGDDEV